MSNRDTKYLTLSGLEPLVVTPESNFINVGERTNVTPRSRVLAAGPQKSPVGLLVDEVFGQRHFLTSDAQEAELPDDSSLIGLVRNEHHLGSESWQEFDLGQLFNKAEFLDGAAS